MPMSDPIQSAFEKFEAARLNYDAKYEYADEGCRDIDPYRDRLERAEWDLSEIEATTPAELLCQLRAWWCVEERIVDNASSEARMIMRLLQGLERLAKAA